MTDERDPKVSAAYRGLGAEEPPRVLDEAILAAARREAGARPALLEARAGRQRWYAPLATAAVLVLAVAVTLNMQTERPGIESPLPRVSAPPPPAADRDVAKGREEQSVETVKREDPAPAAVADAKVARSKDDAPAAAPAAPPAASEPKPFMAEKPAIAVDASSAAPRNVGSSAAGALAQPFEERRLRESQAASAAPARMQQKLADTPERELERIAELRAQGRHDEADRALAEFHKRHPDYSIPEAMRARVERR